jgi:hypothetical protein
VTPNIVAPTMGFSGSARGRWDFAIPATAAAAFPRMRSEIGFSPAMSTTEYMSVTSTAPT